MSTVRPVTVLVGDVTGADGRTVLSYVGHGSFDHGDGRAVGAGLQVSPFVLFDSVLGFESAT